MLRKSIVFLTAWICLAAATVQAAGLPEAKTGGAKGGPIAILFLGWMPLMDKAYGAELRERGYVYASVRYFEPLAPEFLDKFNVFVFEDLPPSDKEFFPGWENHLVTLRQVQERVGKGAGVLFYAATADAYGVRLTWNKEMKPWGVQVLPAATLDAATAFGQWDAFCKCAYNWTENLNRKHPVTAGLRRVYYPAAELGGNGCYADPPLILDHSWTPLVKTSPHALLATCHPYYNRSPDGSGWYYETQKPAEYVLAATKAVGKGRMAVLAVAPVYTHQAGYGGRENVAGLEETLMDKATGIVLKRGNGKVPSDTAELLGRMYAWLAGSSGAAGLGGYVQGDPIIKGVPPPSLPPAGPSRPYKALIGAHSAYSDGQGTVAEYAKAARGAGYSVLAFTENFEKLPRQQWDALVADCTKNSTADFICLPGWEIKDPDGNRFLHLTPSMYPHPAWLTDDGKRLDSPYAANWESCRHLLVAHRADSCPLPPERLKHFQGVSVFTYRGDKLVDNSLNAFTRQVQSGSFPVPIAVHETFSPAEVAVAAKTGCQQYTVESDTLESAVTRTFRIIYAGLAFPMISGGPRVASLGLEGRADPNVNRLSPEEQTYRMNVTVASDAPLKCVTLYDGYTPVRRWLPVGKEFKGTAEFSFGQQRDFWVMAEDAQGRQGLRNCFSIWAAGAPKVYRCTDRQNWLVPAVYPGTGLPFGGLSNTLNLPIKGTDEGTGLFTAMPGACMATKTDFPFTGSDVALIECVLDEKYVDATFDQVGLAVMRSQASKVSSVYAGRVRYYSFTQSREAEPWVALVEYDLTLKRAVEPRNPEGLFPAIAPVLGNKRCWPDGKGEFAAGTLGPDTGSIPRGGLSGGIIPLDDGFCIGGGSFGRTLPGAPDYLPAGTRLTGRFLMPSRTYSAKATRSFEDAPETWLRAMGFAGATPYRLALTRGKLDEIAFLATVTPENYGVAGEVAQTADIPYQVPLQIRGLNPRWPAGLWRDGGKVTFTGVFDLDQTAWPRLDVGKPGKFYAGNLLVADNSHLALGLVRWDDKAIAIEVHNPTAKPIEATVMTPPEITGYKVFRQRVTVPAGTTVYVE